MGRIREMESIRRGPNFGDFVTIRTLVSMQDVSVQDYRVQDSPLHPFFNCNVLRESLSVDSENNPCATLKRTGSWVISVYLCVGWMSRIIYLCDFHLRPVWLFPREPIMQRHARTDRVDKPTLMLMTTRLYLSPQINICLDLFLLDRASEKHISARNRSNHFVYPLV